MGKRELISVIVPVYNVENYLRECIDSVLTQTHKNFELILVDDGSTDGSRKICEEYIMKDNRIHLVCQSNAGASAARNRGLKEANGAYIYFLDSDDWILDNTLETLISIAEEQNSDFVFFEGKSFLDEFPERKIKQTYMRKHSYETGQGYEILGALQNNGEFSCSIPLLFIKKEYIETENLSFEEGIVYEDMLYAYELFSKAETVSQCKAVLYRRRYRENSTMTSRKEKKNFYSAYKVYCKLKTVAAEIKKSNDATTEAYIARCAFNALNYYKALKREDRKICKKDYIKLKQEILLDGAYNNQALNFRCYGTALWFAYKVYEKVLKCLKGK